MMCAETIDTSTVNASYFYISNVGGNFDIQLNGATVTIDDSLNITISLLETQRELAVYISNQPGGDASAVLLDIKADAFRDIGQLHNQEQTGLQVTELPDRIPPTFDSASLNYSTGILRITASETIDTATGKVDLSKIALLNVSNEPNITLEGATVTNDNGVEFTIKLTESQRTNALVWSNTKGGGGTGEDGDGTAVFISTAPSAFVDITGNPSVEVGFGNLTEFPDIKPPTCTGAALEYGTGLLRFTFDEVMDVTPGSIINFSKIYYSNHSYGAVDVTVDFGNPSSQPLIPYRSGLVTVESTSDSTEVVIRLYEFIRTFIIAYSGVPGGDGKAAFVHIQSGAFPDLASNRNEGNESVHQLVEFPDNVGPTFKEGFINYGTGELIIEAHKTMDLTPASKVNMSGLYLSNLEDDPIENGVSLEGADIVSIDGMLLTIYLLEYQKVFAHNVSNTPGAGYSGSSGDGESTFFGLVFGAILDTATNPANYTRGIVLNEIPDTNRGHVKSVQILYSDGTMLITANETVDATPTGLVVIENMTLANNTGDNAISIVGAHITQVDFTVLTIQLTEKQRVAAIALSGTPGGDGGAMIFDMQDAALQDRSGNYMEEALSLVVNEVPDTVLPRIISSVIDYTTGVLVISTSETIDITPSSLVKLEKFSINNVGTGNAVKILLDGASIESIDNTEITLTLTEANRVLSLYLSGTPGGDGDALALEVLAAAYQDIAENKNLEDATSQNTLNELPDVGNPNITHVRIEYSDGSIYFTFNETIDLSNVNKVNLNRISISNLVNGVVDTENTINLAPSEIEAVGFADRSNVIRGKIARAAASSSYRFVRHKWRG